MSDKSEMQFKYEAGYNGKPDMMRSRAQAIMGEEMRKAQVTKLSPHSFSSGEKTKMRNYRKGGSVKCAEGGTMPMPTKSPFENTMKPTMKRGGGVHKEMTTSGKMEKPAALFEKKESKNLPMKKGGSAKMAIGGLALNSRGQAVKKALTPHSPRMPFNKGGLVGKAVGRLNIPNANKTEGVPMKMAIGGSGKIRHKEMTPAGKQLDSKGKPTTKRCHGGY